MKNMKREELRSSQSSNRGYKKDRTIGGESNPLMFILGTVGIVTGGVKAYQKGMLKGMNKAVLEMADKYRMRDLNIGATTKAFTKWADLDIRETKFNKSIFKNDLVGNYKNLMNKDARKDIILHTQSDASDLAYRVRKARETERKSKNFSNRDYTDTSLLMDIRSINNITTQFRNSHNGIHIAPKFKLQATNDLYETRKLSKEKAQKQMQTFGYRNVMLGDILRDIEGKEKFVNGKKVVQKKVINNNSSFQLDEKSLGMVNDFLSNTRINKSIGKGSTKRERLLDTDNWKELVLDEGLMIDANNNFIDVRYANQYSGEFIRSLSNDYQIPFLGFNPLRFFGMDAYKVKKDRYGILHQETIQNAIIKEAGEKTLSDSGQFGKSPLAFINGTVYQYDDTKAARPRAIASNMQVDYISKNNGSYGLRSDLNAFRKMVNLQTKDYQLYNKEEDGAIKAFYSKLAKTLDIGFQDRDMSMKVYKTITTPDGITKQVETTQIDGTLDLTNLAESIRGMIGSKLPKPYKSVNETKKISDVFGNLEKGQSLYLARKKDTTLKDVFTSKDADVLEKYLGEFFGSRDNPQDITDKSIFLYTLTDRLNQTLSNSGLGFGMDSIGSSGQQLTSLFTKRFLPIYGAYQTMQYLTYMSEDDEGGNIQKDIAEAFKTVDLGMHRLKDATGLTSVIKKLTELTPGIDNLTEYPGVYDLGLDRTYEEQQEYYNSGMVAVRKGRFWELGNTPFTGGKVSYFKPNWYRRTQGDVMFSDSKYGSREEYFDNHWLTSPIKHFVTDRYHYDEKHYYDRPYMVTSRQFEDVPIIGDMLASTVGQIIKPQRRMHEEYWGNATNDNTEMLHSDLANNVLIGSKIGNDNPIYIGNAGYSQQDLISRPAVYTTSGGQAQIIDISGVENPSTLKYDVREKGINKINGIEKINLTEQEMALGSETIYNSNSLGITLASQYSNSMNLIGMTGYIVEEFFTGTPMEDASVLDSSGYAYGFNKTFWDQEIGGLGGSFSEIFRRLIPDKNKNLNYVNPVKNTMACLLPGEDYMIDFTKGDPYCVSPDTLIETELGYIKAEDVKINNKIITHRSRYHGIKYIVKRKVKELEDVLKFTIYGISENIPLIFSEEHPILIKKVRKCSFASSSLCRPHVRSYNGFCEKQNCKCKWDEDEMSFVRADNVCIGDAVVYPIPKIDKYVTSIKYSYEYHQAPRSKATMVNGKLQLDKDICWLLGLYCAEGSTAKQKGKPVRLVFSLEKSETDIVNKIIEVANKIIECNVSVIESKRNNGIDVVITNSHIARIFDDIISGNLYEKRIPNELFFTDNDNKVSFLFGYILGDGSINNNHLTAYSANKNLILDFHKLCFNSGIPCNYVERNTRNAYELNIHTFHLRNVNLDLLLYKKDLIDFNYKRQPSIMSWSDGQYIYSIVKKIEKVDDDYVYGFEIDDDDTFCVMGFVTHNTKVNWGEGRLPGEGYERLWGIEGKEGYEDYDTIDKVRILSDVAPYSDEYKDYSSIFREEIKALESQHTYQRELIRTGSLQSINAQIEELEGKDENFITKYKMRGLLEEKEALQLEYENLRVSQDSEIASMKGELEAIEERVKKQKEPFRVYDYKYSTANLVEEKVTIDQVLDDGSFTVVGDDTKSYKLGGIDMVTGMSNSQREAYKSFMAETIYEGNKITLKLDGDELKRKPTGINDSVKAIVQDGGKMLNRELIREGYATSREDNDALSVNVRYSAFDRMLGSIWEKVSHMDIFYPLNTKMLQVRSPLERYERNVVYGEDFQEWDRPVENFLKPSINKAIESPVGLIIAPFIASLIGKKKSSKFIMGAIGFGTVSAGKLFVNAKEEVTGERWIPKSREEETDIDEYIDKLKYVKNMKLYNEYAEKSLQEDGFDVKEYQARQQQDGDKKKARIKKLEGYKKDLNYEKADAKEIGKRDKRLKLSLSEKLDIKKEEISDKFELIRQAAKSMFHYKDPNKRLEVLGESFKEYRAIDKEYETKDEDAVRKKINKDINNMQEDKTIAILPENAMMALQYYQQAQETVYGYDQGESVQNLMRAIPKIERDYFKYFMKAPEEERGEILEVLPDYLKGAMMNMWGQHTEKEPLTEYFKEHQLPGEEWIGWQEDVSLDSVRVKMVEDADMEFSNFNIWDDDIALADTREIPIPHINKNTRSSVVKTQLENVLKINGYENINISTKSSLRNGINFNINQDSRPYVEEKLNDGSLF